MLSIHLSILVFAIASLFCACLVSVQVSAPYVIAVHLSLQADGKAAFEEIRMFGYMANIFSTHLLPSLIMLGSGRSTVVTVLDSGL